MPEVGQPDRAPRSWHDRKTCRERARRAGDNR
jgi:hypothetical protein